MGIFAAMMLAAAVMSAPAAAGPVEAELEAPGPVGPLRGTMLAPSAATGPAMLILPGSGPTDRDGNNARGVKGSIYKRLAEGLAARGIATIRIDKRGMFGSAGAVADANAVTIADYAADVHTWTDSIRQQTGASCVWLLGHSEGGLVALVAAQHRSDVCGLILVSTAGRPLGQALREQLASNPAMASLLEQAMTALATLESGKHVATGLMDPALLPLFKPEVQDFVISVLSYDPAALLTGYAKPVLILQGQRDIQISERDARLLKKAAPKATLVLLANTNHVLKTVTTDDRAANAATYADPDQPLASKVVETIAAFVNPQKNGR
jgi:pimeloyl-ACP methyl ester carboxylesterase